MIICKEMELFRKALDERGVKWHDASDGISNDLKKKSGLHFDMWMCRTHFSIGDSKISVINGAGSYGGFMHDEESNAGLLEMMCGRINHGEPEGNLTAKEAIKMLEDAYGKEWN